MPACLDAKAARDFIIIRGGTAAAHLNNTTNGEGILFW